MANSKAYASFVLLFTFLVFPHVLTHNLPDSHDEFQRAIPPWEAISDHFTNGIDYHQPSHVKDIGAHGHESHDEFQRAIPPWEAISDHFTNAVDYQPSEVKDIEGKYYKDETKMMSGGNRKMMRPREEINDHDLRSFHAFPIKISGAATNGVKTTYHRVPMEKVGDVKTMN